MKEEDKNAKEAKRIVGNMCQLAGYHGTTTTEVVKEIRKSYQPEIMCNGFRRRMVFTALDKDTVRYQTEPA
jgi:DeoR/GlpR family transcriptional regulator of sugar metabolism